VLVQSADPAVTPFIYLTAGEQEPLLESNRRFAARLNEHHFANEFHTKPGGHDWNEWDLQIPGCFESLLAHLRPGHKPRRVESTESSILREIPSRNG
jgi:enterochelin esterase-like enzyme